MISKTIFSSESVGDRCSQAPVNSAMRIFRDMVSPVVLTVISWTGGEALRSYDGGGKGANPSKPALIKRDLAPGQFEYRLPKSRLIEALNSLCEHCSELRITAIRDDRSWPGAIVVQTQKRDSTAVRSSVRILNPFDSREGVTATYPLGEAVLAVVERP
jgi:hypothetical protein